MTLLEKITNRIPEFCLSHWLFRIPLAIIFIQQGLSKFPVTLEDAQSFDLPLVVWFFVAWGELGAGLGLLAGGLVIIWQKLWPWVGDTITRFSGFTIGCIMTGVIWVGEPESFMYVILYDNLHVLLWVGGLYFAMKGNVR